MIKKTETFVNKITDLLLQHRFHFQNEVELHQGMMEVFNKAKIAYMHEHDLGISGRIDFYFQEHKMGLEVKIDGSTSYVLRQVHRYVQSQHINILLLVTSKSRHKDIPSDMNGKEVRVVCLNNF